MYIRDQLPHNRYSQPAAPYDSYNPPMDYQPYGAQPMLPQINNANYAAHSFHKPAPAADQNKNKNHHQSKISNNKSFIDGFDNNSSGIQQKSHKRNLKRLFGNEDPSTQRAKQDKMKAYRDELQRQMEEVKEKKRIEKQMIEKEEIERQRKFYQQFKIQAQQNDKNTNNNVGQHVNMMRTVQNYRKKNQVTTQPNVELKAVDKKYHKRGGYHNQSSLDNFEDTRTKIPLYNDNAESRIAYREPKGSKYFTSVEEELARQKSIEEERISKLMIFQQRVLQKISDIKSQIRNTTQSIDTDKQLARVRNSLRARRSHLDDPLEKSEVSHRGNNSINNFYSLPKRNIQVPPTRYNVKLKDMNRTKQVKNDKNFLDSFHSKLSVNDKNIEESPEKDEGDSVN